MGDAKNLANERPLKWPGGLALERLNARRQLKLGTLSPNPWDLTLWGQNACGRRLWKYGIQSHDSDVPKVANSIGRFLRCPPLATLIPYMVNVFR